MQHERKGDGGPARDGLVEQLGAWAATELGTSLLLHRQLDPLETLLWPEQLERIPALVVLPTSEALAIDIFSLGQVVLRAIA